MFLRILILAVLACGNAVAFVTPLASRAVVSRIGRDHLSTVTFVRRAARVLDGDNAAPSMRYIAMNKFKVKLGCEDEFETMWRERESNLASFSGFETFMLLKVDNGEQEGGAEEFSSNKAGYTEFISHTTWKHQIDFEDWKKSQAFKKSHGGGGGGGEEDGKPSFVAAGGMSKMGDLIVERPTPALFDAVIIEPVPPEHAGGLWDFENEPSYFDGDM